MLEFERPICYKVIAMTTQRLSSLAPAALLTLLLLGCAGAAPAVAQTLAWGEGGGQLWTVDLPGGDMTSIGPTGLASGMEALARTPDGRLLGLVDTGLAAELYEVDTETGAATLVVGFDAPGASGLAVLEDGRIFFSVDSEILELDPSDGSTQSVAVLGESVTALADDGSSLLALVYLDPTGAQMFRVEPADGQTTLINDAAELIGGYRGILVDPGGQVWTLSLGGGILTVVSFVPQRIDDFGAGAITTYDSFEFFFGAPQAQLNSIAWSGLAPLAEVPGPGPLGQFLLALLLVIAGWFVLLRR